MTLTFDSMTLNTVIYRLSSDQTLYQIWASDIEQSADEHRPPSWIWSEVDFHNSAAAGTPSDWIKDGSTNFHGQLQAGNFVAPFLRVGEWLEFGEEIRP